MPRVTDYDSISTAYDRRYAEESYGGIEHALVEFIGGDAAARVLEVGCGSGHWLRVLANRTAFMAGTDLSAGMLAQARRALPDAAIVRGRAEQLAWRSGSFDRVVCINALHHFTDQSCFLREARRVLRRPGGVMTVGLDPHAGRDRWWIYEYFDGSLERDRERYPAAAAVRTVMAGAGFSGCETREVEHLARQMTARAAMDRGYLDRSSTSQLTILSDEEYHRGLDRISADMRAAGARGTALTLHADLHLYATVGWLS